MRIPSLDPLGRAVLGSVGAVALVASLVVPHVGGSSDRTKHHVAGAVRPVADGLVAPPRDEWLRLRADARADPGKRQRHLAPASTSQHDRIALPLTGSAIPLRVLRAYVRAAQATDRQLPKCHLTWNVLAGIGAIESGHAYGGGSTDPHWKGTARPPIYGPLLDGSGKWNAFPDTDGGRLDGNRLWDRAAGPMQFMPSTWAMWGADGNHDGHADPQQVDDAALAAAHYLCSASDNLNVVGNLHRAVHAYNHDWAYVRAVLSIAAHYAGIDPKALGVMPARHHRHARHHRRHAVKSTPSPQSSTPMTRSPAAAAGTTPGATPTSAPTTSPSPTPSPSGSPTPSPTPSPTDTTTPPALPATP
jgi:hypothetical protein